MKEIFELIEKERIRQNTSIELIASENYPSVNVLRAQGSILTCKYAEGYPNRRYYGGCEFIDEIENIAINNACELFDCKFANVQPHSGSQANAAAYRALEKQLINEGKITARKMRILALSLNDGGHLTHGSPVSFSSNIYDFGFYPLGKDEHIDFKLVEEAINSFKPDVLLAGCSAYPYEIDFRKYKELADKYNLKFVVDMAHIAGLVAAGEHISPIPYADIVTTTTHKTLRGPRGGLILTNSDSLIKLINSAVFPYYQGGPLEHIIAAKAICFDEAKTQEFRKYIKNVKQNTKVFTATILGLGAKCSNTENHLMLLNTKDSYGITGLDAQVKLEEVGITANKNMIPNDTETPKTTSGLRIGFAALTTRGCDEKMAKELAYLINDYLLNKLSKEEAKSKVSQMCSSLDPICEK